MSTTLLTKEIRNRAHAFVKEWQGETREHAEAKSFWDDFFQVFGVHRRRIASFEQAVKKGTGKQGFIDLLWKGKLLVEHKSKGKDLDKAYSQALDYFPGLKDEELPRYVLVSDFARFILHDLDTGNCEQFDLSALPDNIHLFDFIAGHEDIEENYQTYKLDLKASELLGKLHDALLESGYDGHPLEVFLVRILFCLFAEDTGIFAKWQFVKYIKSWTAEDGNDTAMHLGQLFQVLDTPEEKRNKHLSEELAAFPYVNGQLFAERLDFPSFDTDMREQMIESAWFDWSSISPAIFGSLFQHIMGDSKARRKLGAHYTSEKHILRLIKPLFLDELYAEFENLQVLKRDKHKKLTAFQKKLSGLYFFDPACGCGNFLIVTYQALRHLELQVLGERHKKTKDTHLNFEIEPLISLDHFYGIELEEWPMRIAEVAMWLTQHQMNREFAQQFGREPDLLPLKTSAQITCGNALELDWQQVVDVSQFKKVEALYLLGNPPFVGKSLRTQEQNADMDKLFKNVKNYKSLDYVCCWFYKAAQFIQVHKIKQKVAFVSTNSISQGEQVAPLWNTLLNQGIHIHFAHRTFAWDSEAKG
ncbi:MAG: DNA methyltransferase, partial [Thiotrichaceae bacterium]|nr:DNA methyltransferase [Thiotrichaceae bacterium]